MQKLARQNCSPWQFRVVKRTVEFLGHLKPVFVCSLWCPHVKQIVECSRKQNISPQYWEMLTPKAFLNTVCAQMLGLNLQIQVDLIFCCNNHVNNLKKKGMVRYQTYTEACCESTAWYSLSTKGQDNSQRVVFLDDSGVVFLTCMHSSLYHKSDRIEA